MNSWTVCGPGFLNSSQAMAEALTQKDGEMVERCALAITEAARSPAGAALLGSAPHAAAGEFAAELGALGSRNFRAASGALDAMARTLPANVLISNVAPELASPVWAAALGRNIALNDKLPGHARVLDVVRNVADARPPDAASNLALGERHRMEALPPFDSVFLCVMNPWDCALRGGSATLKVDADPSMLMAITALAEMTPNETGLSRGQVLDEASAHIQSKRLWPAMLNAALGYGGSRTIFDERIEGSYWSKETLDTLLIDVYALGNATTRADVLTALNTVTKRLREAEQDSWNMQSRDKGAPFGAMAFFAHALEKRDLPAPHLDKREVNELAGDAMEVNAVLRAPARQIDDTRARKVAEFLVSLGRDADTFSLAMASLSQAQLVAIVSACRQSPESVNLPTQLALAAHDSRDAAACRKLRDVFELVVKQEESSVGATKPSSDVELQTAHALLNYRWAAMFAEQQGD